MVIQQRETRHRWLQIATSTLFDCCIAAVAAWVFALDIIGAAAVFAALQGCYLVTWLRATLFGWTWWFAVERQRAAGRIADGLGASKFPSPSDFIASAEDYLREMRDSEGVDMRTRFVAVADLATFQALRGLGMFQVLLRLTSAYELALEAYARTAEAVSKSRRQ